MIIGKGLIANVFKNKYENRHDVLIFASGVSNSKETKVSEFERELILIKSYIKTKALFVYFSTTSIKDKHLSKSSYINHKINMEEYIAENALNYLIVRTSNVIGSQGNKATVINYFYEKINSGENFDLWIKAKRNLIDVDDFNDIVNIVIHGKIKNQIVEVCNFNNLSVLSIVKVIEKRLNKKGNYNLIDDGGEIPINSFQLESVIPKKLINKLKNDNYFEKLLIKYYK